MADRIPAETDETPTIDRTVQEKTRGPKGKAEFIQITIDRVKYWVAAWKVEE